VAAGLVLAAATVSGLALIILGATRPHAWILKTHIATATGGAALVFVWMAAAAARRPTWRERRGAAAVVATAVAAILVSAVVVAREKRQYPERYRIVNPAEPPVSMDGEGAGPQSPFFPSSAETNVGHTIPSNFFMTSQVCGRCHKEIYAQWSSSAHHFSSFNNQWYRKSIEYMQDVVGTRPSKWCAGCHDHAVFFNGRFDPAHQGADRNAGGPGRPLVHVVALHRPREEHHGTGRLHDRVPAAARPWPPTRARCSPRSTTSCSMPTPSPTGARS
jgi:hypothetical protein